MRTCPITVPRVAGATLAAALSILLPSCVGQDNAAFEPLGVSNGSAKATYPAKNYEMRVGSAVVGDATVWSEGREKPTHTVDIRLKLRNRTNSDIAIDLAKTDLSLWTEKAGTVVVATPTRVGGLNTVGPDATGGISLAYELPPGLRANDVTAFRFDWQIRTASGDYQQSTEFVRSVEAGRGAVCPDYPSYTGAIGRCVGWDQGQWFGYDDPSDPGMPASVGGR